MVLQACVPELKEVKIDYFIGIKGVSEEVVKVDDTILVYINWINSPVTEELSLSFDGHPSKTLGLKNDSVLVAISPSGWETGELHLTHPNGAQCTWQGLQKDNHPQVKQVSTFKGVAGDVVTISGKEFTASEKTVISINNHPCEIIEMLDTIIKFKVPDSCGNGLLKMLYWTSGPENCTADKTFELGLFDYDIEDQPQKPVKAYSEYNNHYLLERDILGRVAKRIHTDENGSLTGLYDDFIYNAEGLLESITRFEEGNRYEYITYWRNEDATLLKVSAFNDANQLLYRDEYFYQDEKISSHSHYLWQEGAYYLQSETEYVYTDAGIIIRDDFYNTEGSIQNTVTYNNVEFDSYNGKWPDLGIPGFEKLSEYPLARIGNITFRTFYNPQGKLIRIEKQEACGESTIACEFEYEEN